MEVKLQIVFADHDANACPDGDLIKITLHARDGSRKAEPVAMLVVTRWVALRLVGSTLAAVREAEAGIGKAPVTKLRRLRKKLADEPALK
jgi:hypothetical protein